MEDKNQKLAIMSDSGPALILAGPGSGKTTVLTHHIKYLTDNGVSPDKILVITFTRKAALEMKNRFELLSPTAVHQAIFGTFHSIFFKIIKAFDKKEKKLVSEDERNNFLLTYTKDATSLEYFSNHISFYKSLYDKSRYIFADEAEKEGFMRVYDSYNEWLKSEGLMDYDDIIEDCYKLLKHNKKALSYLNSKFSHILVDEFQDINSIQYETLKLIAGKFGIIFAVGDEDQSIYGFRGATPDIMKQFLKDYKNVTVINLNTNYRSFTDISDFSQKVIMDNTGRLRTEMPTCLKKDSKSHVHIKTFKNQNAQMGELMRDFTAIPLGKTAACLLRTNKEVDVFKKFLTGSFTDEDSFKASVYDDVLAFVEYSLRRKPELLKKVISVAISDIPTILIKDCDSLGGLKGKLRGTQKADAINIFETKLNVLLGLNPFSFSMYLKNIVGLFEHHSKKSGAFTKGTLETIYAEIINISKSCVNLSEFKEELIKYRPDVENRKQFSASNIVITTFHQAKGLEFDYVFIPDVIEGRIPAGMAVSECRVEEERRLFYVALTRAKEELYVYTIKNEESGGSLPSRFIEKFVY
ncbi:MAG: ATP-dependent helicase [Lachnospiraceae bacterium]|nr:ATP-dependent helicase [Lachnospiraceae bacterium]